MAGEAIVILVLLIVVIGLAVTSAGQGSQINSLNSKVESLQNALAAAQNEAAANAFPTPTSATRENSATGVESPWTSTGWFTTGNQRLDETVKQYCDAHSTGNNAYDNAYNTFLNETWAEYVERDDNQNPVGDDWAIGYAQSFFDEQNGNCYNYAAAIAASMRYFGFDDAVAMPTLVELQSGNWGPHGLVRLTYKGEEKLLDSARSSNGWMLDGDTYNYTIVDV